MKMTVRKQQMEVPTEKIMRFGILLRIKVQIQWKKWNVYKTGRKILTVVTAEKKEKAKQQAVQGNTHVGLRLNR